MAMVSKVAAPKAAKFWLREVFMVCSLRLRWVAGGESMAEL
jgi:hypothetical protein